MLRARLALFFRLETVFSPGGGQSPDRSAFALCRPLAYQRAAKKKTKRDLLHVFFGWLIRSRLKDFLCHRFRAIGHRRFSQTCGRTRHRPEAKDQCAPTEVAVCEIRIHGDDANIVGSEFQTFVRRETVECMFGRSVSPHKRVHLFRRRRTHIDNQPPTMSTHMRYHCLHAVERTEEIEIDKLPVGVSRVVGDGTGCSYPCVVEKNINTPIGLNRSPYQVSHGFFLRHICWNGQRLPSLTLQFTSQRFQPVCRPCCKHDDSPMLCKKTC